MNYKITETADGVTRTIEGTYPSDIIRIYNETFGKYNEVAAPVDEMLFDVSKLMRSPSIIDTRYNYGGVK